MTQSHGSSGTPSSTSNLSHQETSLLEKIKSPAKLAEAISGGAWKPYKHLNYISNRLVRAVTNPEQNFMSVQVSVRHGKALDVATVIPTPAGWRRMGDLEPGEEVYAGDGSSTLVLSVSPVWPDRKCYKVNFTGGTSIIADELHEWTVTMDGGLSILESRALYELLQQRPGVFATVTAPPNPLTESTGSEAIVSVERTESRDTVCIEVDHPRHTFLCGAGGVETRNSELITKYFIVWYLGLFPEKNVLIVCYNDVFARRWGRATRDLYGEFGPELFGHGVREDVSSVAEWMTTAGGGVKAVGAGGSITGMGFDLIIIDDPIKNIEEALSQTANEGMREWYETTLRTRLTSKVEEVNEQGDIEVIRQGGTMILTMARWTDYDLAAFVTGEMLEEGEERPHPDHWEVIKLPAVAEPPSGVDDEDWTDVLGRHEGEALWPEQWPIEALQPMMGTTAWDSLYQQNPVPRTGGVFPAENWQRVTHPGIAANGWRKARFWDTASTKGGGDWTVGVLMAVDPDNRVWVLDVVRERLDSAGVEKKLVEVAAQDGTSTAIRYEEAKAAAGKATTQAYARLLIGYDFRGIPVSGTKADRATLYSAAQQNKLVNLCEAPWVPAFIEEHKRFPKGRHDDQVDAAAAAFVFLTAGGAVSITSASEVVVGDPVDAIRRRIRERGGPTGPTPSFGGR